MKVQIGELRNRLSRYLKIISQEGGVLIIVDRNRPVARISPIKQPNDFSRWKDHRDRLVKLAENKGVRLSLPENEPPLLSRLPIAASPAPDGEKMQNSVAKNTVAKIREENLWNYNAQG